MSRLLRGLLLLLLSVAVVFADIGEARAADQVPAPYTGRWVDVNLTTLRATAYTGTKAGYSARVTTGKPGYATPTGTYFIFSRVRIQDMESQPGDAEHYLVKDVQYVQYFRGGGFALHANYWQPPSVFGRANTSHGCVGMVLADAAYFWSFASSGTPVYVHYGKSSGTTPVVKVDSVVGKQNAAARSTLQAGGLKVAVRSRTSMIDDPGTVLAQTPAAGRTVARGATVTLYVAEARAMAPPRPPEGDNAWAPDIIGLPEAEAVARIEQAGLKATYVNYIDEKDVSDQANDSLLAVKKGTVFAALTDDGVLLPRGSEYAIAIRRE